MTTTEQSLTSYDEVPYPAKAFAETHPNRLAVVATLLGMNPPPVSQCRVLELGCASGVNLIPMAWSLPQATFVGIDLSARQIEVGRADARELDLRNIDLRHQSILDINRDSGVFDYIIVHGIYSWVPQPVREKILQICAENLSPDGVAYVSYNTLPGWRLRGVVRDMMFYQVGSITLPQEKVRQVGMLLEFLDQTAAKGNDAFAGLIRDEIKEVRRHHSNYVLHDYLEEVNEPCYFHEFAARAHARGLQYLGEATFDAPVNISSRPEAQQALQKISRDPIRREQYMDFMLNRKFRRTLLCHQGAVRRGWLQPHEIGAFYVSSAARPEPLDGQERPETPRKFTTSQGLTLSTHHPLVKAAMLHLWDNWPSFVSAEQLVRAAREHAGMAPADGAALAQDLTALGSPLLQAYTRNVVDLSLFPPKISHEISSAPVAAPYARLQAKRGRLIANLRHETVELGDNFRFYLQRLDGAHDRSALLAESINLAEQGTIRIQKNGVDPTPAERNQFLANGLEEALITLKTRAFLVPPAQ